MRIILTLLAIGAGVYAMSRRADRSGTAPAAPGRAAFAEDQDASGSQPVRDAGPDAMRDPPKRQWTKVDEESDQSFPASDPPANY